MTASEQAPRPDPFIDEIHRLKRAASERAGHSLERLAARYAEIERRQSRPVIQPPKGSSSGQVA